MLLVINDHKTTSELQDKFNECFPHLKIEFYDKRHKMKHASPDNQRITEDRLIGDIRKKHNAGIMEIKSWNKTGDVEQQFMDEYGLYVQIFRLEDDHWIQSVKSDELTLAEQSKVNNAGVLE